MKILKEIRLLRENKRNFPESKNKLTSRKPHSLVYSSNSLTSSSSFFFCQSLLMDSSLPPKLKTFVYLSKLTPLCDLSVCLLIPNLYPQPKPLSSIPDLFICRYVSKQIYFVGRIMVSQRCSCLNLQTCECVGLHSKRNFGDMIKV